MNKVKPWWHIFKFPFRKQTYYRKLYFRWYNIWELHVDWKTHCKLRLHSTATATLKHYFTFLVPRILPTSGLLKLRAGCLLSFCSEINSLRKENNNWLTQTSMSTYSTILTRRIIRLGLHITSSRISFISSRSSSFPTSPVASCKTHCFFHYFLPFIF